MSASPLDSMTEIRWHSRGGQGGMTASKLLAEASFRDGNEVTAFSFYGAERRGAPVSSFTRIDDEPIKLYSRVESPDVVVVLDESLVDLESVTEGLDPDGTLVMNTTNPDLVEFDGDVFIVDASNIAREYDLQTDGTAIVNTPMLGAVAAAGLVDVDTVETVVEEHFGQANSSAVRAAYERTEEAN